MCASIRRSSCYVIVLCFLISSVKLAEYKFERQRYDGWFNNLAHADWGSPGDSFNTIGPNSYDDFTYQPALSNRPSARRVSNEIFKGSSYEPSAKNRTALFAYFSQMVSMEISDSTDHTCPPELYPIDVPKGDPDFDSAGEGKRSLTYARSGYNKKTGRSLNQPRQQINQVTSWLDGSFIYGSNEVWANCLRSFENGKLASLDNKEMYPGRNKLGLPFENIPHHKTHEYKDPQDMLVFGDKHGHENPAIMSLATMWFRYHNKIAEQYMANTNGTNKWSDETLYQQTRKHVIAVYQNIIVYEWLPVVLGKNIPDYERYVDYIEPEVTSTFETAAMRFWYTLVPSVIYTRDTAKCDSEEPLRLCNVYGRGQEYFEKDDFMADKIIAGLATQLAEKEDNVIVEDLRSKYFGPKHETRRDAVALTIMTGRDFGLAGYDDIRHAHGLDKKLNFYSINSQLATETIDKLHNLYNNNTLDVFTGGMLEFQNGEFGDLFTKVIKEQFIRLRDSDRFWFENNENGLFTEDEIKEIKTTTLRDVMMEAFGGAKLTVQARVFYANESPCAPVHVNETYENCTAYSNYDYFSVSQVSYILTVLFIGLFPFLVILIAYTIYRCNAYQLNKTKKEHGRGVLRKMSLANTNNILASEWLGHRILPQAVEIRFKDDPVRLNIHSSTGRLLRSIGFEKVQECLVGSSRETVNSLIVINVPKEYDLVLQFDDDDLRKMFLKALQQFLEKHQKHLTCLSSKRNELKKRATTKIKRQELLNKFFRSVFAEIDNYDGGDGIITLSEKSQAKDIINCELSKEEFAEALSLKANSMFVEQMFALLDNDGNGYISFRELLQCVILFSKGTDDQRLQLLFKMYDTDNSGTLEQQEIRTLLISLMDMANAKLNSTETSHIIESWFESAGLSGTETVSFEGFKQLLGGHMDSLKLDWKGLKNTKPNGKRQKRQTGMGLGDRDIVHNVKGQRYNPIRAKLVSAVHFLENHKQHIFYLTLFYGTCLGLYADLFFQYSVEKEHTGFRRIAGFGVSVTRGAAATTGFCYALILLTMCRNTLTFLRETFLNQYIPFDSNVAFHKTVAWTGLFSVVLHVCGHLFNFYHLSTQPVSNLCMFKEMSFSSNQEISFHWWLFQTVTGSTGVLATVVMIVIYIFATQISRQYIFNAFWITHKLIIPWYILILLHGSGKLVQAPGFWPFLVGPAILYTMDKLVSISRKKTELSVIKGELLPSNVTHLEFKRPANFEYKSGQWVRIACLAQGKNEYHPFTLTSAPHEDNLSLNIRALGPWTTNLRNLFDPENLRNKPYPKVFLDGPYGSGHQDWYKYDIAVLVGGGIGVTPFASILKDFVHMSQMRSMFKVKCQKLYFVWVTASHKQFEWLIDILRQVEAVDYNNVVSTHIFITQFFQKFDLRTTMLYICEEHFTKISGKSLFTGLEAKTHFGRPDFDTILTAMHQKHHKVKKVGVFSCGPPGLTKNVEKSCLNCNKTTKAQFEHHYENF